MDSQQQHKRQLEKMISGEAQSAIPVIITKKSYMTMLGHCDINAGLWKCRQTGGTVKAKMLFMNVYDSTTMQWEARVPIAHLYCGTCHKVPKVRAGDSIFNVDIQSVYL